MFSKLLARPYPIMLALILGFAFITRIWHITVPENYVFDEVYHAITSKLVARNDPQAYEWWNSPIEPDTAVDWLHPPLAKLTQGLSMKILGENALGWRMSSVVFGVLSVWITAQLARAISGSETVALLSAFLFSLDGLALTQSRIAMNDIHVTFFILLALYIYWKFIHTPVKNQHWKKLLLLSGLTAGLAMGSKWSGVFTLGIFWGYFIYTQLKVKASERFPVKAWAQVFLTWTVIPVTVYMACYGQMFLQGKGFQHFYELHRQIWWYQTSLEATHPYQSVPWQWALNLRPVWYYVDYSKPGMIANIYAQGNTALYWLGLVAIIGLILRTIIHKQLIKVVNKNHTLQTTLQLNNYDERFLFLIMSYALVWMPWFLSPRIMFFYHYLPAVPLLSIILGWSFIILLQRNAKRPLVKYLVMLAIYAIVFNFLFFYPNWVAISVTSEFREQWYGLLKSWI